MPDMSYARMFDVYDYEHHLPCVALVTSSSLRNKCCPTCTDKEAMEYITALPGQHYPIIKDERHVLKECPLY